MIFDKILVSGCSFANGSGLPGGRSNPKIWPTQLANKLQSSELKNVSKMGANNHWIFLETISELIKNEYDLVLVEWSAIPRYNYKVGLELYSVDSMLNQDVNLVGKEVISKKWLSEVKEKLLRIHNDHWDILDLIKYVNVLIEMQVKCRKKKIFFVNGLAPWPDQYFAKKQIQLPSDLDSYTYNLLQVDRRDDDEVFQLYDMIHDHYHQYGGIQEQYWLNLYRSQQTTKIDTVSIEDLHPGYKSQDMFAEEYYQKILCKSRTSNFAKQRVAEKNSNAKGISFVHDSGKVIEFRGNFYKDCKKLSGYSYYTMKKLLDGHCTSLHGWKLL